MYKFGDGKEECVTLIDAIVVQEELLTVLKLEHNYYGHIQLKCARCIMACVFLSNISIS